MWNITRGPSPDLTDCQVTAGPEPVKGPKIASLEVEAASPDGPSRSLAETLDRTRPGRRAAVRSGMAQSGPQSRP